MSFDPDPEIRYQACPVCDLLASTWRDCIVLCPDGREIVVHEACLSSYHSPWPVWIQRTGRIQFPRLRFRRERS